MLEILVSQTFRVSSAFNFENRRRIYTIFSVTLDKYYSILFECELRLEKHPVETTPAAGFVGKRKKRFEHDRSNYPLISFLHSLTRFSAVLLV